MKKQIIPFMACMFALSGNIQSQITSPTPYCAARIASLTLFQENHIKAVKIGTLSNTTGTVYVNGSEYVYYNNLTPVNLQKGASTSATVTVSKNDMETNALWVFVDYNLNNSFEQSELVGQGNSNTIANAPFGDLTLNFSLTIPATAQTGQTRMRIIYTSDMMLASQTPTACNSNTDLFGGDLFAYGEIEDYNVTIVGQTVAMPAASFTSPVSTCKNQNVTLSDNSTNTPTAWSWTLAGATPSTSTAKNPVVKYANAGTYTITFSCSNAGGGSQIISKTISVNACTGLEENVESNMPELHLYPNPAKDYFSLECPGNMKLDAYNLAGEKLFEFELQEGKNTIDLSSQPKGIYFMTVLHGQQKQTLKLIKD